MMNRFVAAVGILALGTGLALAQATPESTAKTSAAAANDTPQPGSQAYKDAKEWQIARAAKTSLAQALTTAEKEGDEQGGRAIDADFEKADGKDPAHYAIKVVYPSGKLVEYGINADTDAVYKRENQPIERYFTRLKPADFNNAKLALRDALLVAEQKAGGGRAYEAEVSKDGSAVQYEIKVAGADKEQTIKVGPDGKVID